MSRATQLTSSDVFAGHMSQRAGWLSPALIGLSAPVVVGLFLAPQLLQGAGPIVALLLVLVLVMSAAGYVLSVVAPGAPSGLIVRSETRQVIVLRQGLIAQTQVAIPFADVARLALSRGSDHDGYDRNALELKTRDGMSWIVACDVDEPELARMRRIIGLSVKSR